MYWNASAIVSSTMYAHLRASLEKGWRRQEDINRYRSELRESFGLVKEEIIYNEIKAEAEGQAQESNIDFIAHRLWERARLVSDKMIEPPYQPL